MTRILISESRTKEIKDMFKSTTKPKLDIEEIPHLIRLRYIIVGK